VTRGAIGEGLQCREVSTPCTAQQVQKARHKVFDLGRNPLADEKNQAIPQCQPTPFLIRPVKRSDTCDLG